MMGNTRLTAGKIPVPGPLCASPRTNLSLEGSLGPVDQILMTVILESHLLSQVSAKRL